MEGQDVKKKKKKQVRQSRWECMHKLCLIKKKFVYTHSTACTQSMIFKIQTPMVSCCLSVFLSSPQDFPFNLNHFLAFLKTLLSSFLCYQSPLPNPTGLSGVYVFFPEISKCLSTKTKSSLGPFSFSCYSFFV